MKRFRRDMFLALTLLSVFSLILLPVAAALFAEEARRHLSTALMRFDVAAFEQFLRRSVPFWFVGITAIAVGWFSYRQYRKCLDSPDRD